MHFTESLANIDEIFGTTISENNLFIFTITKANTLFYPKNS